jgi:S1-C subfamily serine protease
MRDGRVHRSRLGFAAQTVPIMTRVRRFHGLTQPTGVLVTDLTPNGPAARAGFEPGDLLVAFDDEPIAGVDDLHRMLTAERAGRSVSAQLLRRTEMRTLEVVPAID